MSTYAHLTALAENEKLIRKKTKKLLKIPDTRPAQTLRLEVFFVLEDERHDEIHDHRRAYREKGEVNKIHPDACRTDAELAAPPVTNAECALLKPRYDAVDETYSGHGDQLYMLIYEKREISVGFFLNHIRT